MEANSNENKEELIEETENDVDTLSEMGDFGHLVAIILDYYVTKNEMSHEEDGEEWKEGTAYEKSPPIPKSVDKSIEKSFLNQLKRFQKDE